MQQDIAVVGRILSTEAGSAPARSFDCNTRAGEMLERRSMSCYLYALRLHFY